MIYNSITPGSARPIVGDNWSVEASVEQRWGLDKYSGVMSCWMLEKDGDMALEYGCWMALVGNEEWRIRG